MKIVPYLNFDGDCAEAFRFYERVFSGKLKMLQTFGETPAAQHTPPERHGLILHAYLEVGDWVLMGSDAPPEFFHKPQGCFVSAVVDSEGDARRIFDALSEGGEVTMALAPTFWSKAFGTVTDRFGTPWMVNAD